MGAIYQVVDSGGKKALAPITNSGALEAKIDTVKNTAEAAQAKADTSVQLSGNQTISGTKTLTSSLVMKNSNMDITKDESHYMDIEVRDKNDFRVGHFRGLQVDSGYSAASIIAYNRNSANAEKSAMIEVLVDRNGNGHATAPIHTSPEYGNIIVTEQAMQNYTLRRIADTSIYVGGDNASDTADLYNGRGHSKDKPFATISGASYYINGRFISYGLSYVKMVIQGDDLEMAIGTYNWMAYRNISILEIEGDDTSSPENYRRIKWNKQISLMAGHLYLKYLNIEADTTSSLIYVNPVYRGGSRPLLQLSNLVITGECAAVVNTYAFGDIMVGSNVTGDVTGKRYILQNFSRMYTGGRGTECLPGIQEGTCDDSSRLI